VLADALVTQMNVTGAALLTMTLLVLSLYLVSSFSVVTVLMWLQRPARWFHESILSVSRIRIRVPSLPSLPALPVRRTAAAAEEEEDLIVDPAPKKARAKAAAASDAGPPIVSLGNSPAALPAHVPVDVDPPPPVEYSPIAEPVARARAAARRSEPSFETPPWATGNPDELDAPAGDIPIRTLEDMPEPAPLRGQFAAPVAAPAKKRPEPKAPTIFELPPTGLLNEPPERGAYDSQELKDTAVKIKTKFEEFNVLGQVVQINPGPVVTTFEYKPEAGIKYSKITTLNEDLCLGLQAESILIERIPGKPTVGIEVPNSKREMISLRQMLESEEFADSASRLTIALGKDINGRIKTVALETMPHLLVAGSTGSGKSVMLNALIMSVLYKSTPEEVRMILVDPKRVEMGMYEGIPHLLTPVITDPRKATNALRNAVLEMERRLKLLAEVGVRNIDQYNKKVRQLMHEPRNLFAEGGDEDAEPLRPLPYILLLIDELADLMMLERANVEESVARLAQMARAVGMHLVLATQRPSVDVITGLIKANFPSRISFRVATRVDSRTVLDVMGAEHLLGKGDMLFLPPGSSRLIRVHGAFVTEAEVTAVVDFWKSQAKPEYDQSFLMAPPGEEDDDAAEDLGDKDVMYEDAVRVVCEVGKASTSVLQRRLRLGYGRAARILDWMQHEGIIGPPDGSRPRDVLQRPIWLDEPKREEVEEEE
jgi:DNA segregation ATPase FtsK/SpoIIIE, S-DNA-T family